MWLQGNRENLERKVAERTAELRETNRRLRTEIAERKQIETMLREREQRYRDIFDNTSDGIVLRPASDFESVLSHEEHP